MFKLACIALVTIGFIDLQFMLGLPSWIYFMQPQTMLTEHLPTDTSARGSLWKSLRTVLNNAVLTWDARIQQQQPTEQMDLHPTVYFQLVSNHEALTSQEIRWLSEKTYTATSPTQRNSHVLTCLPINWDFKEVSLLLGEGGARHYC